MNDMPSAQPIGEFIQMLPSETHDTSSPGVSQGCPNSAQHKKASSQMESFLRRAKEAGVKIEEDDWEVVGGNEEQEETGEEEWVIIK
jgi:hypothetical protein